MKSSPKVAKIYKIFYQISSILSIILLVVFVPLEGGDIEDGIAKEIKYPNVVKPIKQFGTYGLKEGYFNEPISSDFDDKNHLFILELNNNRIQCFSPEGKYLFAFGKRGSAIGEFKSPTSINIFKNDIYVCDSGNDRIQVFSLNGKPKLSFGVYGPNKGQFNNPYGIFVYENKIYVADQSNNRIQVFNTKGRFLFSFGKYGKNEGEFIHPTDVVVSKNHEIYVCDSKNNRIQKFSINGKYINSWGTFGSYGGLMATPVDLEIFENELLVSDLINHRFQAFDLNGKYIYQWGRHPTMNHEGSGRTHYPVALSISNDGKLVAICEPIENRLQIFSKKDINKSKPVDDLAWWDKKARFHYGTSASVAGKTLLIGEPDTHMVLAFDISKGDNPVLLSKFGGYGNDKGEIIMPSGIAYDNKNKIIYVSDKGNNRIQGFKFNEQAAKIERNNNINSYQVSKTHVNYMFSIEGGFGNKSLEFNEPSGITLSPNGSLFIVDDQNHRVKVYDKDFKLKRVFGNYGTNKGELKKPISISYKENGIDGKDVVYVMEQHNYRIQAFDTLGHSLFTFGKPGDQNGEFCLPFGLVAGRDGSVYVTDEGDHSVKKFTKDGKFIKKWGDWGTDKGKFYKPKGIAQGPDGLLYVLDFGNHRGQIFTEDGEFVNFFGLGELQNGIFKVANDTSHDVKNNLAVYLAFGFGFVSIVLFIAYLRKK